MSEQQGDPAAPAAAEAALLWARERLAAAGVDDPARDARLLIALAAAPADRAVGAELALQPSLRGLTLAEPARVRLGAGVASRAAGAPMSHLLGYRDFYRHRFQVGPDVLDPRAESEILVETALAALPDPAAAARALDLGTGSGCLLLSVLAERPAATGLGVDASPAALAVAAANAAALGLRARVEFRRGDWAGGLSERFDLVLCNPPYIDLAEWRGLSDSVRRYEPKAALTPGADGLSVYRRLAPRLALLLTPGGVAVFEVGRGRADAVAALFAAAGLAVGIARDLGGVARAVTARR